MNEYIDVRLSGTVIGGAYTLSKNLGTARLGSVFRAEHFVSGHPIRQVAVRIIPSDVEHTREVHQMRLISRLNHPNILSYAQIGELRKGGSVYQYGVMDWSDQRLDLRLRSGPLSLVEMTTLAQHIAAALAYLHSQAPPMTCHSLNLESIHWCSGIWKISDFSLVSTRGFGSAADDVHAYGLLMEALLIPYLNARSGFLGFLQSLVTRESTFPLICLPKPFRLILPGCLAGDEDDRLSADTVCTLISAFQRRTRRDPKIIHRGLYNFSTMLLILGIIPFVYVPISAAARQHPPDERLFLYGIGLLVLSALGFATSVRRPRKR